MGILGINHSIRSISQQLRYRGVSLIRDPLVSVMATYRGHVRTRQDAILLFEACQLDVLPKILRRPSRKERKNVISPGAVFVWDEVEAGIQRWTDGRLWGSITLSEEFIVRREMERKARKLSIVQESTAMDVDGEASRRGSDGDVQMEEGTTDDYHYKKNGLIRRSMTITSNGRQLHLVTYDDPTCGFTPELPSPTSDSLLKHLIEEKIASRSASHLDLQRPQIQACEPSRWPSYVSRAGLWNTFRWHHTISQQIQALSAQNVHWGVPPAQIHQWNDTVMNLYRLLASISQSPTNIPQAPRPDSSYRQTSAVCATSASMVPGPDTLAAPHSQYLQMVQSPPSPPRSPKIHHAASPPSFIDVQPAMINTPPSNSFQSSPPNNAIEISSSVGMPASINTRSISCPQCSSLPMPEDTTEMHHAGLKAHEASLRAVGKLSDTRWEDGRRKEICHQTLKVHRDDERVVRSLDKRFLID